MEPKTYTYKSEFSYWIFLPVLVFSGLAFYCFLYDAGIAIRNKTILASPYSYYATGAIAILFLVYSFYKLKAHKDSLQNSSKIKLGENGVSFPHKKSKLEVDYKSINELYIQESEDDGESVIIYTENNKNRYEFFHDYFESTEKYIEFKTHIEKSVSIA